MTRIDFYSLTEGSGGDRFRLTCLLVERVYSERLRIYIHVPDRAQACQLDRLLWTYRDHSFLPHGLVGETELDLTPILIGHDGDPGEEHQVLINLGLAVPTFFDRFERLCEPVDQVPAVRNAGRERYRYYRERGYELHHHQIRL